MKGPKRQIQDRKNRVRKRKVAGRIYETKDSWKGHEDRKRHRKREWASSVGLCQKHKPQHPHHEKVSTRGPEFGGNVVTLSQKELQVSKVIQLP